MRVLHDFPLFFVVVGFFGVITYILMNAYRQLNDIFTIY